MSNETLLIIMATWKRPERFLRTLQLLDAQSDQDFVFYVWNNNPELTSLLNDWYIPSRIYNSETNIGGVGRFLLSSILAQNISPSIRPKFVFFVDDDQEFGTDTVSRILSQCDENAVLSNWAFQIHSRYIDRTRIRNNHQRVDYCGTGGMVVPMSMFSENKSLLDEFYGLPEEFRFIEDLWLSYYAVQHLSMRLGYLSIDITQIYDGKNQYLTKRASLDRKNSMWTYLSSKNDDAAT